MLSVFGGGLLKQGIDAGGALEAGVELEIKFRRVSKSERFADLAADETAGAFEAGDRGGCAHTAFEMREVDAAVTQVVVHPDCGQCDSAQAWVAQIAHEQARQLSQDSFGDALRSSTFRQCSSPFAAFSS